MNRLFAKPSGFVRGELGCYAGKDFKKGEIVGEYTGEIRPEDEAYDDHAEAEMEFLFDLGDGRVIDPTHDNNPVKHINHSCNPNCESEQDGDRIFIRALRDIVEGEELSYEYNLQVDEDDEDEYICLCGSPGCRGTRKEV